MTQEQKPVLLTEADVRVMCGLGADSAIEALRERGLIAEEPVDPLLIEAREIVAGILDAADLPGVARTTREGDEDDGFRVQVALAALRRGREMGLAERPKLTGWQTIETAPKDGTFILAIQSGRHPDGQFYIPNVVQWLGGMWQTLDDPEPDEGWALSHWMPLPANPALTAGQP